MKTTKFFANLVIDKKMSKKEFEIEIVLKSLSLINFEWDTDVVTRFYRRKEKKRLSNKNKKKKL